MDNRNAAYMRILTAGSDAELDARIHRLVRNYLDHRWPAPGHYDALGCGAFLLIDPPGRTIAVDTLFGIRESLHALLEGQTADRRVQILLFRVSERVAGAIHLLPTDVLEKAVANGALASVCPELSDELVISGRAGALPDRPVVPLEKPLTTTTGVETGFLGVYNLTGQTFFGSVLFGRCPKKRGIPFRHKELAESVGKGETFYDLACLEGLFAVSSAAPCHGAVYVPVSYTTLTREKARSAYLERLYRFRDRRLIGLGLTIYDVPLEPNLGLMSAGLDAMERCDIRLFDVQIVNPAFPVRGSFFRRLASVTLNLPGHGSVADHREAAQWLRRASELRGQGLAVALGHVASDHMIEQCKLAGPVFLTGRALTSVFPSPVAVGPVPLDQLPLRPPLIVGDASGERLWPATPYRPLPAMERLH